jgi:DNA-binding Xre family transcriptional regulator
MIAKNVKRILKERKLQRKDLAENIGINKRTLDQKLDSGRSFSEDEIRAIKEFLKVTYDDLLN